jgi:hypothetical protein
MSDACKACGEEWNPSTLRENNGLCPNCRKIGIPCPLIIIDETCGTEGERVCGEELVLSDGVIICPNCEESFIVKLEKR